MSEMKKRVANAIGCPEPGDCSSDVRGDPESCLWCLERAERAIEGMREPTQAMLHAGYEASPPDHNLPGAYDIARRTYQAMIDAAEGEGT